MKETTTCSPGSRVLQKAIIEYDVREVVESIFTPRGNVYIKDGLLYYHPSDREIVVITMNETVDAWNTRAEVE